MSYLSSITLESYNIENCMRGISSVVGFFCIASFSRAE
jgi:hypothetical protein